MTTDPILSIPLVGGPYDGLRVEFQRRLAPLFVRYEQDADNDVPQRTIDEVPNTVHEYQRNLGVTPASLEAYPRDPAQAVSYLYNGGRKAKRR